MVAAAVAAMPGLEEGEKREKGERSVAAAAVPRLERRGIKKLLLLLLCLEFRRGGEEREVFNCCCCCRHART